MSIRSSIVFFPCFSIVETTDFYVNIIGIKLHQDQGSCRIFDTGYGYIGFCEYSNKLPIDGGLCISFNCDNEQDVDHHYKYIASKNCKITTEPGKHPDFPVYSFFMKDPNGYTVEFQKIVQ